MSEQAGTFSSNIVEDVEIPAGRIAAWRYRRALRRRVSDFVSAGIPHTPSGTTTYRLAISHPTETEHTKDRAHLIADRARATGIFAAVTQLGDSDFDILLEGDYEAVRAFACDFFYRAHLDQEIC